MASNYPLYRITYTFAQNGNKKIPPATASAAGTGRFSQAKGFDQINSKPLNQGGIPPYREDFNGAFYLLSSFLKWYQQGGIMKYDATLDYELDNEIYYNGNKYRCIQANGASTTVKAPTDSAYWQNITFVGSTVLYVPQTLTTAQKQQARTNIGAISLDDVVIPTIDAVLYTAQTLTNLQQSQARTNIGAHSTDSFNSLAITKVSADHDKIEMKNQLNAVIKTLYKSQFPNLFSHLEPTVQTVLWAGDSDHGDITLSTGFDNFDALMFIFSQNDYSPSTGGKWLYNIIPVWILKKVIIDKNLFGISEYFDICQQDVNSWYINTEDSTTTVLKHFTDNKVHMWRVVGLRFTTTVTPENG